MCCEPKDSYNYTRGWVYVKGNDNCRDWAKISPDGKFMLIGEYSCIDGVKETIRLESLEHPTKDTLILDGVKEPIRLESLEHPTKDTLILEGMKLKVQGQLLKLQCLTMLNSPEVGGLLEDCSQMLKDAETYIKRGATMLEGKE